MLFLDTCALLLLQEDAFLEPFTISSRTLMELEDIKTSGKKDEEVRYKARHTCKLLLQHEGEYEVVVEDANILNELTAKGLPHSPDNIIMQTAALIPDCEFVTADVVCRLIARNVFGLNVRDAKRQEFEVYNGYKQIQMCESEYNTFLSSLNENPFGCLINEYLIVYDNEYEVREVFKWTAEGFVVAYSKPLRSFSMGDKIKPKDEFQRCAIDSLMTNTITVLSGRPGSGKAQPNSTLIPTKNGYVQLGDIKPGDKVFDRHGRETTVLSVHPQGVLDNYKVTFSDGRVAYCNDEHIWSCYTSRGNLKDFTVRDMIESPHCSRFEVPLNKAVEYNEKDFPIHPYVIGVFLGDGCCLENALTVSSNDEEVVARVANLIGAKGYAKEHPSNYSWYFMLNDEQRRIHNGKEDALRLIRFQTKRFFAGFEDSIIQRSGNKKIPEIYKYGSIEQRKELLRGLLDTDGNIHKVKGRLSFSTTSKQLAQDVREVCWSLGYKAFIAEDPRTYKYTSGNCFKVSISCPMTEKASLFYLPKKKNIALELCKKNVHRQRYNRISIVSIEKVGREEMTCIYVNNPEHLYLTEDYIVTHNTLLALSAMMHQVDAYKLEKIVVTSNPVPARGCKEIGFLPGSANDKLLGGNLGNILTSKFGDRMQVEMLIQQNKLRLLDISACRGSEIKSGEALFLTEAQNTSIDIMKILLSRVSSGAKVVIDGDFKTQLDNSMFAGENNGLLRAIDVFKGSELFGTVNLPNVHRSKIAELAEKL